MRLDSFSCTVATPGERRPLRETRRCGFGGRSYAAQYSLKAMPGLIVGSKLIGVRSKDR